MEEKTAGQNSKNVSKGDLFKVTLDESMDISRAVALKESLQEALLHIEGVYLEMSQLVRIDAAIIQLLMIFANAASLAEVHLEWDKNSDVFNRAVEGLDVDDYFFQLAA